MRTILTFASCLAGLALCAQAIKTPFLSFADTTGSQNFFYKSVTKTDGSGNIYVAGATVNGAGNRDLLLAKYNAGGNLQWIEQYDGAAHAEDFATALYIDGSGNVFVTGAVTTNTATSLPDLAVIKYNSSGVQQWLSTFDGSGNSYDAGADITLDGSGNIYVTGGAYNATPNSDIVTLKYNSSGTQQWASQFDPPTHKDDAGLKLSVSGSTVTVSVGSQSTTAAYRFGVFKYAVATGSITGSSLTSTITTAVDLITDMATDASGNIFLSGAVPTMSNGYDMYLIKFNSSLTVQWQQTYNGADNLDDAANGIATDVSGNLYVSGYVTTASNGKDFVTQKYNSSGTLQWTQSYNSDANGDDAAADITLDNSGNVYSSGYKASDINLADYYTVKYDGSGTKIWDIQSDFSHQPDMAMGLVIDSLGDVIVTGQTQTGPGAYKYYTVKYIEKDVITPTDYNGEVPADNFSYYPNKGQIVDTTYGFVSDIQYYTTSASPRFYIKKNSLSLVFSKIDTIKATADTLHRIDLVYKGVNTNAKTYPLNEQKSYLNYFLGYLPAPVTGVFANQRVVTPDLYSNIDLVYSSNQNGIKLYYIIKPGGNPADIQLEFNGASSYSLDVTSNALSVNSAIGSLSFDRPTAYQLTTSNATVGVTGWTPDWTTNGASNKYKFNLGSYTSSLTLVIEVDQGNLVTSTSSIQDIDWSTFYGANGADYFNKISADPQGGINITGETGSSNFPVSQGASQTNNAGSSDAFLIRFNKNGVRQWATYFGGADQDQSKSGVFDKYKSYYITGNTQGNVAYPATQPSGAYVDNTFNGDVDVYVAKFDSIGLLRWSTVYGSSGGDYGYNIDMDNAGNLIVVGTHDLIGTFPTLSKLNAYNSNVGRSFILKFDSQLQRNWVTKFGNTNKQNVIWDIEFDGGSDYYVVGRTQDSLNVLSLAGASNDTTFNDSSSGLDGFIAAFKGNQDTLYWCRYIGGNMFDEITTIKCQNRNIYLTGNTGSPNFPYSHVTHQYFDSLTSFNGCIMKFSSLTKQLLWSTGFKGSLQGSDCDKKGNFVAVGYVPNSLPTTQHSGSYWQPSSAGGNDGFISVFDPNTDSLIYSTYVGGYQYDIYKSIACSNNYVYCTGYTESGQNGAPIYPLSNLGGSPPAWWQPTINNSSNYFSGCVTRFNFTNTLYTGINEPIALIDHNIVLYPNPNNGGFYLNFNKSWNEKVLIEVFDVLGKRIYSKDVNVNENQPEFINLEGVNSSIYFVSISGQKQRECIKFIKY